MQWPFDLNEDADFLSVDRVKPTGIDGEYPSSYSYLRITAALVKQFNPELNTCIFEVLNVVGVFMIFVPTIGDLSGFRTLEESATPETT